MSGWVKKSTGLTGLLVAKDVKKSLEILYRKILDVVGDMPETAAYRQKTEMITQDRLQRVTKATDNFSIEDKFERTLQAEELVVQAERELQLARKMLVWKPWEGRAEEAPPNQWKWPI